MKYKQYKKYKDSGFEWIGKIPEHWEVLPVKYIYDIQLGKMLQPNSISNDDVLVPYIKALHVSWDNIETRDLPKMWANQKEINQFMVTPGDLLVSEGGDAGRSGILNHEIGTCIIQNAIHRVRAKNTCDVNFLWYILRCCYDSNWIEVICNKATIRHFTREKLAELKIPLPSSSEIFQIIEFLKKEIKKVDTLIEKIQGTTKIQTTKSLEKTPIPTFLSLLQEKRQAIITAAVTGKIDVRNGVAV